MARHAIEVLPAGALPDPVEFLRRQIARDQEHTAWRPTLLARKHERMRISPFAFLRGTAPLYYELLAACPALKAGPPGEGWLVGDLHIENFGAIRRASPGNDQPEVVFSLNDFDDAVQGPWYFDVLRLTTSVLLAARGNGADGGTAIVLGRALLDAYRSAMTTGRTPKQPKLVTALVESVAKRTRTAMLDQRTKVVGKSRKFIHGERYAELSAELRAALPQAMEDLKLADGSERPDADHLALVDGAFRVAGTGSLGCRRVAALVAGKGGTDGCWIFDLKEESEPSATPALDGHQPHLKPNERVVAGAAACLERLPLMMGTTTLAGMPMLARRLMPQEDKIDSTSLRPHDFGEMAEYYGALAALAHQRGATKAARHPWSTAEGELVLSNATTVAGWHEAAYLAYCHSLQPT